MHLSEIMNYDSLLLDLKLRDLNHAFDHLSALASELTGVRQNTILSALQARAQQGLVVQSGAAIPHARVEGLRQVAAFYVRLREPIIENNEPIDTLFLLLAPHDADGQHLRAIAKVAGLLRQPDTMQALRAAPTREDVWQILTR